MPKQISYKKSIDEVIQYFIQKYDAEKLPFDHKVFRFGISNAFGAVYSDELSEIAMKSGLGVMEQRVLELEDIEIRSAEKQLKFDMYKILDNEKNKEIFKRHGQHEDIYIMFEHTSNSINSNCKSLADEMDDFRGIEIIQA